MRVLFLTYYFPPSGGPGVQRGVKLCRHLPDHGVEPVVVTVEPSTYDLPGEYDPDPSLAEDLPTDIPVLRTSSGDRTRLKAFLARTRLTRLAHHLRPSWFFERQAGWFTPALEGCLRAVGRHAPDVLLTTSQPYVAHLVGREVRRRTGIPWVADFRDPWTLSWGRRWPSRDAFRWEDRREQEVLRDADVVVMNTPGSRRELLERRPWLPPGRVDVVPNGYDPEDLNVPPAPRPEGELLVVHSGSFRARPPSGEPGTARRLVRGLGYGPVPYDLSTHSPGPLLRALALLAETPEPPRIRVRLAGPLEAGWLDHARKLGVADRLEVLGPLPHRAALSHVMAADLLYLPTITRADGGPVSNVPAKTYEYLGSGRPVVCLAGPGDVRDLLEGRGRVVLSEPGNAEALAGVLAGSASGSPPAAVPPDPPDARPWSRSEVARGIAASLGRACGRDLSPAGR